MTIATDSVARAACEARGWTLSNLALQKTLYIMHMVHLGRTGQPLLPETFEAWNYGPVLPHLYRQCVMFGAKPVKDVFYRAQQLPKLEADLVREASDYLAPMTPGQMVDLTHWEGGAWAAVYQPGIKHIPIPNSLIADEYRKREATVSVT